MTELFGGSTIKDSTRKLYIHNLTKLNGNKLPTDTKFLKKVDEIMESINGRPKNTARSYLIAVVSALKKPEDAKLYSKYYPHLEAINKELKSNTTKSEKQVDNWLSQDLIKQKQTEYMKYLPKKSKKELTETEYDNLLHLLILSLYTLIPPRRILDYIGMMITDDDKANTYNKSIFTFRNYKTAGTYKTQIEVVPKELNDIIKVYLKYKPKNDYFLSFYDGKPMNHSNQITRILNKIFSEDGKKISVNMLRNIFLTDKFSPAIKEMEQIASQMGTSVGMIKDNYAKQD
jgi:hypothetical protein